MRTVSSEETEKRLWNEQSSTFYNDIQNAIAIREVEDVVDVCSLESDNDNLLYNYNKNYKYSIHNRIITKSTVDPEKEECRSFDERDFIFSDNIRL